MKQHKDGSVTLTPDEATTLGLAAHAIADGGIPRSTNFGIACSRAAVLLLDPDGKSRGAHEISPPNFPAGLDDTFVDAERGIVGGI